MTAKANPNQPMKEKTMSNKPTTTDKFLLAASKDLGYCDPVIKNAFHREGKKVLHLLAQHMGLLPGSYQVRSNKGGIAVSGEIILHSGTRYVMLCQAFMADGSSNILFRSCKGQKDYTGGPNNFASFQALKDMEALAARINKAI